MRKMFRQKFCENGLGDSIKKMYIVCNDMKCVKTFENG